MSDPDREEFSQKVQEILTNTARTAFLLSSNKYDKLIQHVKEVKTKLKKGQADYRRIRRYNVVTTPDGKDRLVTVVAAGEKPLHFVKLEEMYDIIREYHLKMNHAGRTRLLKGLKTKYKNVTGAVVNLYLSLCEGCKNRTLKPYKNDQFNNQTTLKLFNSACEVGTLIKNDPLSLNSGNLADLDYDVEEETRVSSVLSSRGQFEILDVKADEEYKYLLVYRNLVTKFVHLKPLKTISITESVNALLDIFLIFGAPNILQSKNGTAVTKQICRGVYSIFSDIKIVSADTIKNYHEMPGQSNEDILKMLGIWLKQNNVQKWYDGVKYVQYTLNNVFNLSISQTPSESVFGSNPKRGIASFMRKMECVDLITEKDLKTALEKKESVSHSEELITDESDVPSESCMNLEEDINFDDDECADL